MSFFFNEIFYKPLFNALIILYQTIGFFDLGVSIIILTILIRSALSPFSQKAIRSQKQMMTIQPEIKKIQEKYKNNKEEQAKQMMLLYKEKEINPFSGCLPVLIQLPVLIALYWVFIAGFNEESLSVLYSFVQNPGTINHIFLGFLDLSKKNIYLAVLAGVFQFYQSKMMLNQQGKGSSGGAQSSSSDFSAALSRNMTYMMPVMTVFIAYRLHAGLAVYWITTTLFSIFQQRKIFRADGTENKNKESGIKKRHPLNS